jgi:hypothetical protein
MPTSNRRSSTRTREERESEEEEEEEEEEGGGLHFSISISYFNKWWEREGSSQLR